MLAAALAAFVAGVFVLQQQAERPTRFTLGGLALAALALRAWRRRAAAGGAFAAAVLLVASCSLGFAYAGWRAAQRLEVALVPEDEGRDVEIVGVVAGLPTAIERGVRFEFAVEQVHTAGMRVPPRLSLAWYGRKPSCCRASAGD